MRVTYRETLQLQWFPNVGSGMFRALKPKTTWKGQKIPPVREAWDNGRV